MGIGCMMSVETTHTFVGVTHLWKATADMMDLPTKEEERRQLIIQGLTVVTVHMERQVGVSLNHLISLLVAGSESSSGGYDQRLNFVMVRCSIVKILIEECQSVQKRFKVDAKLAIEDKRKCEGELMQVRAEYDEFKDQHRMEWRAYEDLVKELTSERDASQAKVHALMEERRLRIGQIGL